MKRIATYRDFVGELKVTYRRTEKLTKKITSSRDVADFMRPYFDECMDDHEEFKVLHLNNNGRAVNVHHVSSGTNTGTLVDIKSVVRSALQISTNSCCIIHNHPSGGTTFSQADKNITQRLKIALEYFDIKLLDSLLITRETHRSMADEGLL
ncbi:JAB domain-containing protein [Maribacter sp.]|uniref:JAB domain-containing protein n=1 Tax=Maribacter sp. TaxID=1897614 RepID=UPI0025BEDCCA|nr:JAB domain-containing protein [Maribacter sp.]|tara:strand:+ start:4801 stop:5256 length:456 start_codon:yes stop_codon:yes gene_type:complete